MNLSNDLIKQIKESSIFEPLQEYILSKIGELDTVAGLQGLTLEQAGEEVLVRQKALVKLEEILKPFMESREKRGHTVEEIEKSKRKYGV